MKKKKEDKMIWVYFADSETPLLVSEKGHKINKIIGWVITLIIIATVIIFL